MSLTSRILDRFFKLPPAETRDIAVERDLPATMPNGAVLLADRYFPRGRDKLPTILIRSPYGRGALWASLLAVPFAERGFQVVIQSCRGTFGSGGAFEPLRHEQEDGLATAAWLKQQPWFSGAFATFGVSYLGFVQWAIGAAAGPELKAMAVQLAPADFRTTTYPGETFFLDTALSWMTLVEHQEKPLLTMILKQVGAAALVRRVAGRSPLLTMDEAAVGRQVPFFRNWLTHTEPGDPWWRASDYTEDIPHITAPVHLMGGVYDLFFPQTLADYALLRRAGQSPHLTIGPWSHRDSGVIPLALRESLAWFRAHLLGDRSALRALPVRVFVMGADEWRDFSDWPPPGASVQRWHLRPGGGLSTAAPAASEPDHYTYDPNDPTPSVGGSSLSEESGRKDNRKLEARPDVLLYTSEPLDRAIEVIGPVTAELYVDSSLEHADFFARLCDVHPSGKSFNVCDGIIRLSPGRPERGEAGCRRILIDLWATANRFERGHRIRLQVSSGAHPRFARNPGSGEPLATATRLVAAEQTVFHDPVRPSAVLLPVLG